MEIIKVENMSYSYPLQKEKTLENISFSINKGEFISIIGNNGSGKTTLCNILRRFIPDFYKGDLSGKIEIFGKSLSDLNEREIVEKIGYIFQNPFTQITGLADTVFEEIAYGLQNLGVSIDDIKTRVDEVMKLIGIEHLSNKNPKNLSGGQKQCVAIASIIVMNPDILIFDEPTSQLDPISTEKIFEIIKGLSEKGKTIILVEHKIDLIYKYTDKIIAMNNGKILEFDIKENVLSNRKLKENKMILTEYSKIAYELEKRLGNTFEKIPVSKSELLDLIHKL